MQIKSLRIKSYRSWAIADTVSEAAYAAELIITFSPAGENDGVDVVLATYR